MPISQYYRNAVLHRCEACGHQRRLAIDDLEVGLLPDAHGEIRLDAASRAQPVISLPPCEKCASVEIMSAPSHNADDARALWALVDGDAACMPHLSPDLEFEDPTDDVGQDAFDLSQDL